MATKRLLPLAALALLAACAPTVFIPPPGVDEAGFHRDNFDCAAAAKNLVGEQFAFGPPLFVAAAAIGHDNDVKAAHDECMLGKGYTKQARQ